MSFLNPIAQAYLNTKLRELVGWRCENEHMILNMNSEIGRSIMRSMLTFRVPVRGRA